MRFGIVELSLGMVVRTGRNWERMKEEVESHEPSRWDNPVLVVLPEKWRAPHEEGEIPFEYVEENVVAVPFSGWGYGTEYAGFVEGNRRKFGLLETFEPPSEMIDTIRTRKKLSELPFSEAITLLAISPGGGEEAENLKEKGRFLKGLIEAKERKEKEEIPKWAQEVLGESSQEPVLELEGPRKPVDLIKHARKMGRRRALSRKPDEQWRRGEISYEERMMRMAEIETQLGEEFGDERRFGS